MAKYEDVIGVGRVVDGPSGPTIGTSSGSYNPKTGDYTIKDFKTGKTITGSGTSADYDNAYSSLRSSGGSGGGGSSSGGSSSKSILDSLGTMRDGYVANQKGLLDSALSNQLTQLESAYQEAIAEGKISVRDAQDQYAKQKEAIEKQAYINAEHTGVYGQNMGIQNSQQMQGLMQGDQARTASLKNTNMSDRDMRINNIQDRLNSISKQKDLAIADAHAQRDYGLASAQGQADQMYGQNMFNFQSQDHFNKQAQGFAQQNMATQQGYNLDNMATQQDYNKENMSIAQNYNNLNAIQQQEFTRENMFTNNEFDKEKMGINFANDLQKMATQHGYSSALQSQAGQQAMSQYIAKFQMEQQAEIDAYNLATEREYAKGVGGTKENVINERQKKEAFQMKLGSNYAEALSEKNLTQIYGNVALDGRSTAPKDYTTGKSNDGSFFGGIMNAITGYDKKQSSYEDRQKAEAVIRAFESNPFNY